MPRSHRVPDSTTLLGLEADAGLRDDPQLLGDPRRLGALHAHLTRSLGEADAAAALFQAGYLHGLRDAQQAVAPDWEERFEAPSAPRIAMSVAPRAPVRPGVPDWVGIWVEQPEAEGHIADVGPSRTPACHVSAGYTSGWISGLMGAPVLALEIACAACGAERCTFRAQAPEAWRTEGDPAAVALLDRLDVERLHAEVVATPVALPADPDEFDPEAPVVHVWGPVMVVPFGGTEECLAAVELIAHDDGARDVSVVVIDLAGAIVDEGYGAVALERVLEAVEARGADVILTGVSPLSQAVVDGLEARHLTIHKDLPDAIATAFQIADAQRHVY